MTAPEISLDRATGAVLIGNLDRLLPWERKSRVEPRVQPFFHQRQDHGNGYQWLYLTGFSFGNYPASLALCFAHERLEQLDWSVSLPNAPAGWPTSEAIDAEIAFVRGRLVHMIGFDAEQRSFALPWGQVWSYYDPKAGFAANGPRYLR